MAERATFELARAISLDCPRWIQRAVSQRMRERYTGTMTLHFHEGRITKTKREIIEDPQDYTVT